MLLCIFTADNCIGKNLTQKKPKYLESILVNQAIFWVLLGCHLDEYPVRGTMSYFDLTTILYHLP